MPRCWQALPTRRPRAARSPPLRPANSVVRRQPYRCQLPTSRRARGCGSGCRRRLGSNRCLGNRCRRALCRRNETVGRRFRRTPAAQGRRRLDPEVCRRSRRERAGRIPPRRRPGRAHRRHAACRCATAIACSASSTSRTWSSQASRSASRQLRAHGHPHRDGHRRQPGNGRGNRLGSRRRRFPRRSDAGRQARAISARNSRAAG